MGLFFPGLLEAIRGMVLKICNIFGSRARGNEFDGMLMPEDTQVQKPTCKRFKNRKGYPKKRDQISYFHQNQSGQINLVFVLQGSGSSLSTPRALYDHCAP